MTYVPPTTNAGSLYNFLLQQMAAESYFEKPMSVYDNNPQEVIDALTMGTNRKSYTSEDMPFNGGYPGLTRMTKAQAEEFVKKFKIIHQWSDNPCPDGSRPTQPGDAGYLALNGQQNLLDGLRRMFAASRSGAGLQPGLRTNPRAACSHARRRTST